MRIEPKATNAAAAKLAVKEFLTKKTTEQEIYFYSRFVGSGPSCEIATSWPNEWIQCSSKQTDFFNSYLFIYLIRSFLMLSMQCTFRIFNSQCSAPLLQESVGCMYSPCPLGQVLYSVRSDVLRSDRLSFLPCWCSPKILWSNDGIHATWSLARRLLRIEWIICPSDSRQRSQHYLQDAHQSISRLRMRTVHSSIMAEQLLLNIL
jgi:hypothetical protein